MNHNPPPPAPDLPVPGVSPALAKGTGTRAIGDRLRFWRALALLELGAWQALLAFLCLLGGQPPDGSLLLAAELLAVLLVCGQGARWVGLTYEQDLLQLRFMRSLWTIQLAALRRAYQVQAASRQAWDNHWWQQQIVTIVEERPVAVRGGRPQDHPAERPTVPLPALAAGFPPRAYYGQDLERVVAALLAGQSPSVRRPPPGLNRPAFEDAVEQLSKARVVTKRIGRGPALVPALARLASSPATAHAEAYSRLAGLQKGD